MEPEEPIQDNEPENNTPEEQGQTSSNPFSGQTKNFTRRLNPPKIKGNATKTVGKMGKIKRGIQAAKAADNAKNTTDDPLRIKAIFELISGFDLPPYSEEPFSAKAISSTPKLVYKVLRTTTSIIIKLIPLIKIILIIIIIYLVLKTLNVLGINTYSSQQLTASGPVFAKIGDKLDYTITVNYPGTAKDIIITDKIPAGTEYVNAPQATYDPATNTITWSMAAITVSTSGSLVNNINTTLSLTLLATKDNNYIINTLKGTILDEVLGVNDSLITPTLFQTALNTTPTVFQLAPTNIPVSLQDTNIIKSCVVTKVGNPEIIPSLPPECQ